MKHLCIYALGVTLGLLVVSSSVMALTAEQLNQLIHQGEKLTIIDVRKKGDYSQSHIPGALNIPAQLCAAKSLPPLGRVIVYGDGLDPGLTMMAVEALRAKPGLYPEVLEGGFQRWEALNYPATRQHGMEKEKLRHVSYQELQQIAANNPDLVLVDLRQSESSSPLRAGTGSPQHQVVPGDLTALTSVFPAAQTMALEQVQQASGHDRLYVLIDSGDGTADRVTRRLKEAGIKRLAILAGGELTLRRQGQPGVAKQ